LCAEIQIDPSRPFVLYTVSAERLFPQESRMIDLVIEILRSGEIAGDPQIVLRAHPYSDHPALDALAARHSHIAFAPGLADLSTTPSPHDTAVYSSLLKHASLGINGASTVSLELMIHDKPVINLGFDPPGARLPHAFRYARHLEFDHFRPVVSSGAVLVARSSGDMKEMIVQALTHPEATAEHRRAFLRQMFDDKLDAHSGERIARSILDRLGASAPIQAS
ncbi:MAG: hypothetical protein ACRD1T_24860, partial [Acidimicrobiia bacterium]